MKVEQTQTHLQRARAHLQRALGALQARLVDIYKSGDPNAAEILLNAHGFRDLANRAEMVGRIENSDADLAKRVRSLRNQVKDALTSVRQAKAQQDAYNARVSDARDQIASVRATAEQQAAKLDAARQQEQAAIATLQSNVSTWENQVQQIQAAQAPPPSRPAGPAGPAGVRRVSAADGRELGRQLGDPAGDRHVRVRRKLQRGQPLVGRGRRVPDPPVHVAALRRQRRPTGRVPVAAEQHRRPDLGGLRPERLGLRAVAAAR